jgi:hypothetical protein
MHCLYEMSWASRWHFRQSTFRQQVGSFLIGGGVGGAQNLGNGGGVVNEGEGGAGEVGVTDIDGLGGGNVGVDGYGREGGSEETSITSGIFGGSEDDLLGGEARRGGRGNWGELVRGGRHSCELAPSCLSSSSLQHHFLVLLAGGGAISGK